jgi:hypothetical protein
MLKRIILFNISSVLFFPSNIFHRLREYSIFLLIKIYEEIHQNAGFEIKIKYRYLII